MKKHTIFRWLMSCLLLSILLTSSVTTSSSAKKTLKYEPDSNNEVAGTCDYLETDAKMPKINAKGAILMDADTGQILYSKNGTKKFYPASTTKCMTSYLAVKNLDLSDTITYSQNAIFSIEQGSSSVALNVGEKITVDQTLYAMMLESANEACNGVAEKTSGTISAFVDLMNQTAKDLGAVNTHFANPNGLYSPKHYSCPHDMALIVRAAMQDDNWVRYSSTQSYTCPPTNKQKETRYWFNHHKMVSKWEGYEYDGVIGGKTGYTVKAHYSLVTYAERNGMKLISVVMNDDTDLHTYQDTKSLFNYGFNNFTEISPVVKDSSFNFENMNYLDQSLFLTGTKPPINIIAKNNSKIAVSKKFDSSKITGNLSTNVDESSGKLGTYEFISNGQVVTSFDVFFTYNDNLYNFPNGGGWFYKFHIDFILMILLGGVAALFIIFLLGKLLKNFQFSRRSSSLGVVTSSKRRSTRSRAKTVRISSSYGYLTPSKRRHKSKRRNRRNKKKPLHF